MFGNNSVNNSMNS